MDPETELRHRGQPPAQRDAAARGPADETLATDDARAADVTRRLLRHEGVVPIEPDDRIATMLSPGEQVVTVRRGVSLERRKVRGGPDDRLHGDLYVTTRRVVYLGGVHVEYTLGEVRDAVVATGALRLVVGESHGVEIGVSDPRLLRVELAAVREAERASTAGETSSSAPTAVGDSREVGASPEVGDSPGLPEPPA